MNSPQVIVGIGDSGVGKTTLSSAFAGKPVKAPFATIGLDFHRIDIVAEDSVSRIHVWDCSGQDQFFPLGIPSARHRSDSTFIVVYDVTKPDSFARVQHWVDIARNRTGSKAKIIIIGNKTDLHRQRRVSMRQGMELANSLRADFLEMSALEDPDVRDTLLQLVRDRCCYRTVSLVDSAEREASRDDVALIDEDRGGGATACIRCCWCCCL